MKILDLEQNSLEWYKFRRSHIGASDIPVLMLGGKKEIYDLFMSKLTGELKYVTPAMQRGKDLEPKALSQFNEDFELSLVPKVGLSEDFPWLMASFDGYNGIDILEIKCPTGEISKPNLHPSYKRWWWQVQAQMAVSGLQKAFLMVYNPSSYRVECIGRDEDAIKDLIRVSEGFHKSLIGEKEPPEGGISLIHREDEEMSYAVVKWLEWKGYLETAMNMEKEMRERVLELSNDESFECHGVKVSKCTRKGNVDYKSIPELEGVDLEVYRKPPTTFWTFES